MADIKIYPTHTQDFFFNLGHANLTEQCMCVEEEGGSSYTNLTEVINELN